VGKPLTQHFTRYAPDEMPVVVYDSKGLEQGFHEEFVSGPLSALLFLGGGGRGCLTRPG